MIGLYLRVEKGFSGQAVQKVHMQLGKEKRTWPQLSLPTARGTLTPTDVLAAPEGNDSATLRSPAKGPCAAADAGCTAARQ
jgi:hypothetical protein